MSFDSVVTHPGRLKILTVLAQSGAGDFVAMRAATKLTDGNLASHARRLSAAGLIQIDKQFRAGKPVTSFVLTRAGRSALESHVQYLMDALRPRENAKIALPVADEEWVD